MTETATGVAYDPIPDLAHLLCAAERMAVTTGGVEKARQRLYGALGLPELAYPDEAEAAIRKALETARAAPVQQIDLTAPSGPLTYVEILTPGGIVRVNTNLADTRTGRPVVVVEVEPDVAHWNASVNLGRTDITLTRRAETTAPTP